jgi:hypothetical protein
LVENDEVVPMSQGLFQTGFATSQPRAFETEILQASADSLAYGGIVLNEKDSGEGGFVRF